MHLIRAVGRNSEASTRGAAHAGYAGASSFADDPG